ncbi:alpha/beta-hydrolase, partial [Fistulina hepatica ATCC 64428]
ICNGQRLFIYPEAYVEKNKYILTPTNYGLKYEDITLTTRDGVHLQCYLLYSSRPRLTLIVFLGNAMNIGQFIDIARMFLRRGCHVLLVSYRGFAKSTGAPSERGLCIDAQTALDYAHTHPSLSKFPIIVYGLSLGGAVAISVASRNTDRLAGLIIENTFLSIPRLVKSFPYIGWCRIFVHQRWNSAARMRRIGPRLPVMMISGGFDEVVPPTHMAKLWQIREESCGKGDMRTHEDSENESSLSNETSPQDEDNGDIFKIFPFGRHHDTFAQPGYWQAVDAFFTQISRQCPTTPTDT